MLKNLFSYGGNKNRRMNHEKNDLNQRAPAETSHSEVTDNQEMYPRIRIRRINDDHKKKDAIIRDHQTGAITTGDEERPRLRRTRMPSAKVLERRERQRALNERIRDTFFDRINGNFFPKEQIDE